MAENQFVRQSRLGLWLDAVRTIAMVGLCAVSAWALLTRAVVLDPADRALVARAQQQQPRPDPPIPTEPLSLEGAWVEGSSTARVVLIEFSDFECPFCSRFAQTALADVRTRYVEPGKVQLAFRHFPLVQIHPRAMKAAQASECAGQQGRFWPMHDAIFADQARIEPSDLLQRARSLALDEREFARCLDRDEPRVKADISAARALDVTGTPTIFLGVRRADGRVAIKRRVTGAVPSSQLTAVLDAVLAEG